MIFFQFIGAALGAGLVYVTLYSFEFSTDNTPVYESIPNIALVCPNIHRSFDSKKFGNNPMCDPTEFIWEICLSELLCSVIFIAFFLQIKYSNFGASH